MILIVIDSHSVIASSFITQTGVRTIDRTTFKYLECQKERKSLGWPPRSQRQENVFILFIYAHAHTNKTNSIS